MSIYENESSYDRQLRAVLPESYPARAIAILQDLDLWADGIIFSVPYNSEKIYMQVNCSDLFDWATADAEPLAEEDMPLFEQTLRDLEEVEGYDYGTCHWEALYCARKRKMRPQGAWLYGYDSSTGRREYCPKEIVHLFEAAGPERETNFFNPAGKDGWDHENSIKIPGKESREHSD